MRPRAVSPGLLRRRYSVPETVMRRYRLAREQSEVEDEAFPTSGQVCAPRDLYRRAALLRRLGVAPMTPCCCEMRSLSGSQVEVSRRRPEPTHAGVGPPHAEPRTAPPLPDFLEVVVTETSPADIPRSTGTHIFRPMNYNIDVDGYVSNILMDSLNSLSYRLENMAACTGGDSRMSVVEKEIKVKLQNKVVSAVVHLCPTSNNETVYGNKEICKRELPRASERSEERKVCDQFENSATSWSVPRSPRTASPCVSYVDSLEDPLSPRVPPQLQLDSSPHEPSSSSYVEGFVSISQREKSESFFIRMNEDNCACERENIVVADLMPERIKQRLYQRHRRREIQGQRALRKTSRRGERDVHRQCAALIDSLIDDAVMRIAREEYRYARIANRQLPVLPKDKTLRTRPLESRMKIETPRPRAEIKFQPSPPPPPLLPLVSRDRGPRRLYHKSEIQDVKKCMEILQIVEYSQTLRGSSETNTDESVTRSRKSRIPVPIQERNDATRSRRIVLPQQANEETPARSGPVALSSQASILGSDSRAMADSIRFEKFDLIPEQKSSLSVKSKSNEAVCVHHTTATAALKRAPASAPPPISAPARRAVATGTLAPPGDPQMKFRRDGRTFNKKNNNRDAEAAATANAVAVCAVLVSASVNNKIIETPPDESKCTTNKSRCTTNNSASAARESESANEAPQLALTKGVTNQAMENI